MFLFKQLLKALQPLYIHCRASVIDISYTSDSGEAECFTLTAVKARVTLLGDIRSTRANRPLRPKTVVLQDLRLSTYFTQKNRMWGVNDKTRFHISLKAQCRSKSREKIRTKQNKKLN